MMSVNIGKVSDQQIKMNGWLVGSFIKDSEICVRYPSVPNNKVFLD